VVDILLEGVSGTPGGTLGREPAEVFIDEYPGMGRSCVPGAPASLEDGIGMAGVAGTLKRASILQKDTKSVSLNVSTQQKAFGLDKGPFHRCSFLFDEQF